MNTSCGIDPDGTPYDLDLRNSGSGWTGTFAGIIHRAVKDIIDNGLDNDREWIVEVTLADGTVYAGEIGPWSSEGDTFTVHDELPMIVAVDDVVRFRA